MAILISGSVAYDSVCSYGGRFDEMLLPDELSHLNLTFLADTLERYFGGCAGNIAWAMKAAGGSPRLLAMLGKDGAAYRDHLDKAGIDSRFVKDAPDEWTAQAFITTDSLGNQLTTFHAGAMDLLQVPDHEALSGVSAAHIAPGGLRSMASQGELYRKLGIPYVFDPGQATSQLSPAALTELSLGSMLICVSEYEEKLLADRTGLDKKACHAFPLAPRHTGRRRIRDLYRGAGDPDPGRTAASYRGSGGSRGRLPRRTPSGTGTRSAPGNLRPHRFHHRVL